MTARAHLAAVLGTRQSGWVFIGIGTDQYVADTGKVKHGNWEERSFRWPDQANTILNTISATSKAGADVYFTPALSDNPVRKKTKNPKHSRKPLPVLALWADLDGNQDLDRLGVLCVSGGCWLVASGSGDDNGHLYVPLTEPAEPAVAEDLLRRLAAWLGGDPAPTWHGSYLRPVGSKNWKRTALNGETPSDVRFEVEPCPAVWSISDLDDLLPAVEATQPTGRVPEAETVGTLEAGLKEILAEAVTADMDRSKRTMAAVGACVDAGLTDGQIITAMRGHAPTVAKYDGRADGEVARALGKIRAQQPSTIGNGSEPDTAPWARPILGHIRDFARARRCSPWAVLGVVLTRVAMRVPPFVVLPPLVGSHASLNLYVGLVGPSGGGKDSARLAASDAVDVGHVTTIGVGSGEGVAHQYVRYRKPTENDPGGLEQHTEAVLFTAGEVDTLGALKTRLASTLLPELRKAWTGDELGFAYVDKEKRLRLDRHTYRLCLIVGIQPERATVLLEDADAGTPQRFLWMPATDPHAPNDAPAEPAALTWQPPKWEPTDHGKQTMKVCATASETIHEARLARLRGDGDALDAHALLARLKVAAVLAILDGRTNVAIEDWELAGTIQAVSDRVRQGVVATLAARQRETNQARGAAEGERSVIIAETLEDATIKRVARSIQRKLSREWFGRNDLRHTLASRDRQYFDDAIDRLVDAGQAEAETTDNQGPDGVRYRRGEGAT